MPWAAQVERLVLLKTLRNKANVQVEVTVGGKQMTMDQAIAKKAMLAWQKSALANFKAQLQKAQLEVTKADADVQISVDKAVAAAVASNALTTEQSNVFKAMYEQSLVNRSQLVIISKLLLRSWRSISLNTAMRSTMC